MDQQTNDRTAGKRLKHKKNENYPLLLLIIFIINPRIIISITEKKITLLFLKLYRS